VSTIFIADGKSVEEIFDGDESGALKIRRAARTDALEVLERRRQGERFY
jgi:hypothetical protein